MKRALAILLILVLCLSFGYASIESVHDCHGESECPICRVIAVLSHLFAVTAVCFVCLLCFALARPLSACVKERVSASRTLIDLGVKLSN